MSDVPGTTPIPSRWSTVLIPSLCALLLLSGCDGRPRPHHRGGAPPGRSDTVHRHPRTDSHPHRARRHHHRRRDRRHGASPRHPHQTHHTRMHDRPSRGSSEPVPSGDTASEEGDTANGSSADTGAATAGRRIYRRSCAGCHGQDRRGSPPTYPSLRNLDERMSRARARRIIVNGRRAMPPFSHLSDTQQANLLDHLFTAAKDD